MKSLIALSLLLAASSTSAQVFDQRIGVETTGIVDLCEEWNTHFVYSVETAGVPDNITQRPIRSFLKVSDGTDPLMQIWSKGTVKDSASQYRVEVYVNKFSTTVEAVANDYLEKMGYQLKQRCPDKAEDVRIREQEDHNRMLIAEYGDSMA